MTCCHRDQAVPCSRNLAGPPDRFGVKRFPRPCAGILVSSITLGDLEACFTMVRRRVGVPRISRPIP